MYQSCFYQQHCELGMDHISLITRIIYRIWIFKYLGFQQFKRSFVIILKPSTILQIYSLHIRTSEGCCHDNRIGNILFSQKTYYALFIFLSRHFCLWFYNVWINAPKCPHMPLLFYLHQITMFKYLSRFFCTCTVTQLLIIT